MQLLFNFKQQKQPYTTPYAQQIAYKIKTLALTNVKQRSQNEETLSNKNSMSFYIKRFNNIKVNSTAIIKTNADKSLVSHNTSEKGLHEQLARTFKYNQKMLLKNENQDTPTIT